MPRVNQSQTTRATEFDSFDEKRVSFCLEHFLNWRNELGRTYQRPISETHDADFYLPKQNLILEWHPPVLKWYSAPGGYSELKALQKSLSDQEFLRVQNLLCNQINYDYFKRRRAIMDLGKLPGVAKMRLVVCKDMSEFFQLIIKPYSKEKVTFNKFKNFLEKIK